MKSTNFNMQPTPSKTLGDHPMKRLCGIDGLLRQNVSVELLMIQMLKQFSLQLGEAGVAN